MVEPELAEEDAAPPKIDRRCREMRCHRRGYKSYPTGYKSYPTGYKSYPIGYKSCPLENRGGEVLDLEVEFFLFILIFFSSFFF